MNREKKREGERGGEGGREGEGEMREREKDYCY